MTSGTIVLTGDREPFDIVFEMRGPTITVGPGEAVRLVATGPDDADLTIGYGTTACRSFVIRL